jgi:hypothetical protein
LFEQAIEEEKGVQVVAILIGED